MSDISTPTMSNTIFEDISYTSTKFNKEEYTNKLVKTLPYPPHKKYGSYKPMEWTIEVKLNIFLINVIFGIKHLIICIF